MALESYSKASQLKRALLNIVVKGVPDSEVNKFKKDFYEMDKDKNGLITCKDLEEYLRRAGYTAALNDLETFTRKVNRKGEAYINYDEFLAAVVSTKQFLTAERLEGLFKLLDFSQKGTLSKQKIAVARRESGQGVQELGDLLASTDAKDDQLSYNEFREILLN